LWSLSSNDNPYADWALIEIGERIAEARQHIAAEQKRILAKLDDTKRKGLDYSIVQSRSPSVVRLGFSSPYGFMVAMLIVDIDFFTRVVKSAQRRDLLSSKEGHELLQSEKHRCRSAFERSLRYQRLLCAPDMMGLSRLDFLPTADESGQARVVALHRALGAIPKAIFMGQQQPRHSKRRLKLSEAEIRLLEQVSLTDETVLASDAATSLIQ
jgi:integrating conjugative element protein (TIGR03761 family)